MSKLPLIHFDGALFHITARGNNKQEIFLEPKDFQRYLQSLETCRKKMPFELFSFILMPNHLHLLIQVHKYPISKIMQVLQTGYSMFFNKKYTHSGHLFQGRYHSFLVEKEAYLLQLVQYIHLNAVRAGLVKDPKEYPWSSHLAYLEDYHEFNRLIDKDFVLANISGKSEGRREKYEKLVLVGMDHKWQDIFPEAGRGYIIGSEKYILKIGKIERKALLAKTTGKNRLIR